MKTIFLRLRKLHSRVIYDSTYTRSNCFLQFTFHLIKLETLIFCYFRLSSFEDHRNYDSSRWDSKIVEFFLFESLKWCCFKVTSLEKTVSCQEFLSAWRFISTTKWFAVPKIIRSRWTSWQRVRDNSLNNLMFVCDEIELLKDVKGINNNNNKLSAWSIGMGTRCLPDPRHVLI